MRVARHGWGTAQFGSCRRWEGDKRWSSCGIEIIAANGDQARISVCTLLHGHSIFDQRKFDCVASRPSRGALAWPLCCFLSLSGAINWEAGAKQARTTTDLASSWTAIGVYPSMQCHGIRPQMLVSLQS